MSFPMITREQAQEAKPAPLFVRGLRDAIRSGEKTQTRRPVDLQKLKIHVLGVVRSWHRGSLNQIEASGLCSAALNKNGAVSAVSGDDVSLGVKPGEFRFKTTAGILHTELVDGVWTMRPDDLVWYLREPLFHRPPAGMVAAYSDDWDGFGEWNPVRPLIAGKFDTTFGRLDWNWKNNHLTGMQFPKQAARTFLRVTRIRIQRLQTIECGECWDEGIESWMQDDKNLPTHSDGTPAKYNSSLYAFGAMWDSIYNPPRPPGEMPWPQPKAWDGNPWVWTYDFERVGVQL